MTPQSRPLPDNSADATQSALCELEMVALLQGEEAALEYAQALVRRCLEAIRCERGAEAELGFLQQILEEQSKLEWMQ